MSVVWAPRDAVREYPPMFVVDHPPCLGANPPCVGEDPGVHHDAAIHVRPIPGSAGALAGTVSQDVPACDFPHLNLIRPALPGPCRDAPSGQTRAAG